MFPVVKDRSSEPARDILAEFIAYEHQPATRAFWDIP